MPSLHGSLGACMSLPGVLGLRNSCVQFMMSLWMDAHAEQDLRVSFRAISIDRGGTPYAGEP